jgi:hypothetical protein
MHIQVEEKEVPKYTSIKAKGDAYSSNHICQPSHGIQCKKVSSYECPSRRRVWML